MPRVGPTRLRSGGLLQSGIPRAPATMPGAQHGLMRGVVVATYTTDDEAHPLAKLGYTPSAVYCDVMCVGSFQGGSRFFFLPGVQVSQPFGGVHKGAVYKPRATTRLLSGKELSDVTPQDINQMDGDHVLVGLLEGRSNLPVIIGALPHPSRDMGQPSTDSAGARQRLRLEDGDPHFCLHHGAVFGIGDDGGFVVDTTRASTGQLDANGAPVPSDDGGDIALKLPEGALRQTSFGASDAQGEQAEDASETLSRNGYLLDTGGQAPDVNVRCDAGNSWQTQGASSGARGVLGDGASPVALADAMARWWTSQVQPHLVSLVAHVVSESKTKGLVPPILPPPVFDPSIIGASLKIPRGLG